LLLAATCPFTLASSALHALQLPGTLVFDYPSVNAVTEYLTAQMLKAAAAAAAAAAGTDSASGAEGAALQAYGGAELVLHGDASSALVPASLAPAPLAVLATVTRPLMAHALKGTVEEVKSSPAVLAACCC